MNATMTRRRLLSSTILATARLAVSLLFGARVARAFTVETMPADAQRLYLAACGGKDGAYHRQLIAEVRERLENKFSEAQIEAAIAAATCPVCGCPILTS